MRQNPHQSRAYDTPGSVYRSGIGGGALIVDKYGDAETADVAMECV